MSATMNCPKCHIAANGELAGKVGFSGPVGGPLMTPKYKIWDGSQISELLFETADLPGLVAVERRYAAQIGAGREIVVVTRPLDLAMAKMYTVMMKREGRIVHICPTMTEAWAIAERGA